MELLFIFGLAAFAGLFGLIDDDDDNDPAPRPEPDPQPPITRGTSGGDLLSGDGDDTVLGYRGDDTITVTDDAFADGSWGNDSITADGNATANGGPQNDTLTAGGDATVNGGNGSDTFDLYNDAVGYGDGGTDQATVRARAEFFGGDGNDTALALREATIHGEAGEDTLTLRGNAQGHGGDGHDQLALSDMASGWGDDGADRIVAGGNSTGWGGDGDDTMSASGASEIYGEEGNDELAANDTAIAWGGSGNDMMYVRASGTADAGSGNDAIIVQGGTGQGASPTALGGDGDDMISIREGTGRVDGGAGDDILLLNDIENTAIQNAPTEVTGGDGADRFMLTSGVLDDNNPTPPTDAQIGTITDFDPDEDMLVIEAYGGHWTLSGAETVAAGDGIDLILKAVAPSGWLPGAEEITRTLHLDGLTELDLDSIQYVTGLSASILAPGVFFEPTEISLQLGSDGADTLTVQPGQLVNAGDGDDSVDARGYAGDDPQARVLLGEGADTYVAGADAPEARVFGEDGADRMTSEVGPGGGMQIMSGDAGNDMMQALGSNAAIFGGNGNDMLFVGADAAGAVADGGNGADTISFTEGARIQADADDSLFMYVSASDTEAVDVIISGFGASDTIADLPELTLNLDPDWTAGTGLEVIRYTGEPGEGGYANWFEISVGNKVVMRIGDVGDPAMVESTERVALPVTVNTGVAMPDRLF